MSYILEALKKSDQQRQRGTTPTLPAATVAAETAKKPVYYGMFAAALLGAGIAIGLLRPWQVPATEPAAARSPAPILKRPAPTPPYGPSDMAGKTVQQPAAKVYAMQAAAPVRSAKPGAAEPVPTENPADAPQRAITELPASIQQEIPAMTIQFHAYSSIPANRMVSVNSMMLHEGESLMPGLRLEQITVDGMIFSYKGYRFLRGIR